MDSGKEERAEKSGGELYTWLGRPVESLTHDELLTAFKALARMHQGQRDELSEARHSIGKWMGTAAKLKFGR